MVKSKKEIALDIFEHFPDMTKEQYEVFQGLFEDLVLECEKEEPSWDEIFSEIK